MQGLPLLFSTTILSTASSNQSLPTHCAFASVGGGWAGIYAAWRVAIDTNRIPANQVCLFEASARFGGRTYTVRGGDQILEGLNIDVGAYRFAFEQHLPADLIRGPLNIPTACYIPSCKREPLDGNLTLHKLMNTSSNSSAGYGTALDVMLHALRAAGAHLVAGAQLAAVRADPSAGSTGVVLEWSSNRRSLFADIDGALTTIADSVLLNLPRHAVNALAPSSVLFGDEATRLARRLYDCSRESAQANYTREASVKVYLVYADAWWRTKLGLREGEVREPADPPVYIRYHDGPVKCERHSPSLAAPEACSGALLVQYAHSLENGGGFYMPYRTDYSSPLSIVPWSHSKLPAIVHAKLMAMHAARLRAAGVDPASIAPPTAVVAGYWPHSLTETRHPAPDPLSFTTAPGHTLPKCLQGLGSQAYSAATRKPLPGRNVYVANNDWWLEESKLDLIAPYWAEVSLRVAERVLHDYVGLAPPSWLDAEYFRKSVMRI